MAKRPPDIEERIANLEQRLARLTAEIEGRLGVKLVEPADAAAEGEGDNNHQPAREA